ncbi:MAG: hypothetical protein WBA77_15920 [Microcoleaceae cyanobacterium]
MPWITQSASNLATPLLIERILTSGQLNRWEYLTLMSAILSNRDLTIDDRHQINRIFDYVQTGRLKLINF